VEETVGVLLEKIHTKSTKEEKITEKKMGIWLPYAIETPE
jgi:hypothetical protein